MGLLPCSCPLPCNKTRECQNKSTHFQSEFSTSSLSSQPSLPSVPSLSSPSQNPHQDHQCLATLRGHSSYVSSLAVTGKFLYSGSSDSEIRAWPREPPQNYVGDNIIAVGNGAVKALVVLKDKLISAHQDHKIRVWKMDEKDPPQKYKCLTTLPTVNDRLTKLFNGKNYVEVRRHKKCTWVNHVDTVSSLALSKDGSLLYSSSWDRTFKIWRTSDFKCLESKEKAHEDAINTIVVSCEGFVYTGSADKKIKVWKKEGNEKRHSLVTTLEKHESAINAVAISEDGKVLYSGACDRSIIVWERTEKNEEHMRLVGALRGHKKAILCLVVVLDMVFSGSADNCLRIWRRGMDKGYSCLTVLEGHYKPVKSLAVSIDSDSDSSHVSCMIYSGSLDLSIKVWKIRIPVIY